MAHMVWGKGGLLNAFLGGKIPTFDFAGGTVVHITSGRVRAGVRAVSGQARGISGRAMKPHSLVLSFIGACLLWVGWFGFNAGSAVAASPLATSAFVATHFGAAAATLGLDGLPSGGRTASPALGGISGCVAGLVAITPASGFVQPFPALLIGVHRGYRVTSDGRGEGKFGYDDTLDAFGVHGAGGTMGAILTGMFRHQRGQRRIEGREGQGAAAGLVDGNPKQVLNQAIGC
jgi:Amt family ammonium transporter